jgi:hypothetical protein
VGQAALRAALEVPGECCPSLADDGLRGVDDAVGVGESARAAEIGPEGDVLVLVEDGSPGVLEDGVGEGIAAIDPAEKFGSEMRWRRSASADSTASAISLDFSIDGGWSGPSGGARGGTPRPRFREILRGGAEGGLILN